MTEKTTAARVLSADINYEKLALIGVGVAEPGGRLQIQRNLDGVVTLWDHHMQGETGHGTPLRVGLSVAELNALGFDEDLRPLPVVEK